jgi:predicted phage terminase large subunit-like protein
VTLDMWEAAARAFEPRKRRWATPGELARDVDPTTIQTPALDVIDAALVDVSEGRCDRLIISMPPQEGKSTRTTKFGSLWFLTEHPHWRIGIVSYASSLAEEFGRDVRGFITNNQGKDDTLDIGLRIAPDNGGVRDWKLEGHRGGLRSVGLAGGLTGRPVDALIIDDPISNREQAYSETFRERAKSFWRTVGSTRLAPGAPVILILTRWHHDDLAGYLLSQPDKDRWRVINIPAQADHDPAKGETDILRREPGEWMQSARVNERTGQQRTPAEWEQIRVEKGSRDFASLYQGRPTPDVGNVLPADWWDFYTTPQWITRDDGACIIPEAGRDADVEMVQSWDLTFKDTKGSDFVVGQVWLRRGVDAYLLDQVRARLTFTETCLAIKTLSAKWPQAVAKLVEDKANGPAVLNALRSQVGGLIPVEPEGSKYARASAISPLVQSKNVHLPDPVALETAWVGDFIEECRGFPAAAHDDQVDALSQAVHRLLLVPLLDSSLHDADDLLEDEYDEPLSWAVSYG